MSVATTVTGGDDATASQYNNLLYDTAPPGALLPFAGSTIPTNWGWLFCYGQAVSRTTYSDLFGVIGTTYGVGDGSTTFNLPDLRGRIPLGKDNMGGSSANVVTDADADTLGATLGEETHTLTEAELPQHSHSGGTPFYANGGGAGSSFTRQGGAVGGTATITTGDVGSDDPHNNLQPSITMNYIIKY